MPVSPELIYALIQGGRFIFDAIEGLNSGTKTEEQVEEDFHKMQDDLAETVKLWRTGNNDPV